MNHVSMPQPFPRIDTLAQRLHHYAIAINVLAAVQDKGLFVPGEQLPDDAVRMHDQLEALKAEYLMTREEFEKLRANYEHDFMTWHTTATSAADRLFTGEGAPRAPEPQGKAWGGKVPEWADDENNLTALLEKAAEKAAAHNEGV